MIPLSSLAMSRISEDRIADASAIYNTLRNIGGSIGICLVSTLLVTRTLHHIQKHAEAKAMTVRHVLQIAYRDSLIESFSDSFTIIAWGLLLCLGLILFLKKSSISTSFESGH